MDEPLQEYVHKAVLKTHRDRYDWIVPTKNMVADGLLGRFRRQFERNAVTMFPVARTTILSQARKGQEKKRVKLDAQIFYEHFSTCMVPRQDNGLVKAVRRIEPAEAAIWALPPESPRATAARAPVIRSKST